jgi:hypothetical protein
MPDHVTLCRSWNYEIDHTAIGSSDQYDVALRHVGGMSNDCDRSVMVAS